LLQLRKKFLTFSKETDTHPVVIIVFRQCLFWYHCSTNCLFYI